MKCDRLLGVWRRLTHRELTNVSSKRVCVLQKKQEVVNVESLRANAYTLPQITAGPDTVVKNVGHTRYQTSSRSTRFELHPRAWTPHDSIQADKSYMSK